MEKVLFYARLGAAEKDCLIREISLRDCVMDVLARNRQLLMESGASIHTERLSHTVRSDSRWLAFLLTQLISNSLKYRGDRAPVLDIASREAMSRTGALSPRYFRLLEISWVSRKASHLESERTVWERRSVWMLAPLSMRSCLFRASTSMTQSRREISRMRQSFSAAPRRA